MLSDLIYWIFVTSIGVTDVFEGGCDLLSDLIYWIFVTRKSEPYTDKALLWFAFRFDLLDICHKTGDCFDAIYNVVICFQIWFIGYLSQEVRLNTQQVAGCDLLSDLIYWIFVTSAITYTTVSVWLWFAFRFDLLDICHKGKFYIFRLSEVVICFQIWFIGYLSQGWW